MKKIVLVEDDRFLSKMYTNKLLQEEGFAIQTAKFGREGIDLIKQAKPDLVLLDIVLPDISGVQVLKAIRQSGELKDIPVLMLTNLNEKGYINEALSLGAQGYLIKAHFTPNEVVDKIKQLLRDKPKPKY